MRKFTEDFPHVAISRLLEFPKVRGTFGDSVSDSDRRIRANLFGANHIHIMKILAELLNGFSPLNFGNQRQSSSCQSVPFPG